MGAVTFLVGIVGFILDARHHRSPALEAFISDTGVHKPHAGGLSPTAYDLIHVASWALLIAGAVLLITGFIAYSARLRRAS